ncbi:MAG: type II toxin-antitoxin system RelE/ParE family toxin [Candidatus Gracilibacteria bacterium]|nr:type II toxin-antitoxin system RelE/ParE family toxin [Candidatus Gracilibacteria bacterium]
MKIKINACESLDNSFLALLEKYEDKDKMKIMNCIYHIVDKYNGRPVPPLAKPLFDTNDEELFEFRVTLSTNLIRINYFIDYENNCIVILNAYEKPNGAKDKGSYNKANKKDLDKKIDSHIQEALKMKKQYFINNEFYYEL